MKNIHYCNNYIYKRILSKATLVFKFQGVIAKISMRFHQTREQEKNRVEEKYTQCIDNKVTKAIKTSDAQQLACKTVLNNFAIHTWPEDCIDELTFPLKQRLKLSKQRTKITSVDDLQQKVKPKYQLNVFS